LRSDGLVSLWQLAPRQLEMEAREWAHWIRGGGGSGTGGAAAARRRGAGALRARHSRGQKKSKNQSVEQKLSGPKRGREDNLEHHGGNTFAGGTGGRDTAGLGGRGGPYRLDKGFDVHQVPDDVKASVPEEVRRAARALAEQGLRERLHEIGMTAAEGDEYVQLVTAVERQIRQVRAIFQRAQARQRERVWLPNQTDGDLDERRLVDAITGETTVFRRRGEDPFEMGLLQAHPKRLRFVFDLSGSMYRFDGVDGRLARETEAAVLLMEALAGLDPRRLVYDMGGHSGDSPWIPLVAFGQPPEHAGDRWKIVQRIVAHTQFCSSGDFTLEAIEHAVTDIVAQPADEYIVVVLSDANLHRYGIRADALRAALDRDPRVATYLLFIGSLGAQAQVLVDQLPTGRAFLCMDPSTLPGVFQHILSQSAPRV